MLQLGGVHVLHATLQLSQSNCLVRPWRQLCNVPFCLHVDEAEHVPAGELRHEGQHGHGGFRKVFRQRHEQVQEHPPLALAVSHSARLERQHPQVCHLLGEGVTVLALGQGQVHQLPQFGPARAPRGGG